MEVIGKQHAVADLFHGHNTTVAVFYHWCSWNMQVLLMPELVWMLWSRNQSLASKGI